eukprot:8620462-Pyramimonas_sp.AAC.1
MRSKVSSIERSIVRLNARSIVIGGGGVRSKWKGEPPYREIDLGFVSVRAVRAGEAKLRGRARE